jgi:hypothetical protein
MFAVILITYVVLSVAASVVVLAACIVAGRCETRRGKPIKRHAGRVVPVRTGRLATGSHRTRGNTRLVPR